MTTTKIVLGYTSTPIDFQGSHIESKKTGEKIVKKTERMALVINL
jgi:hypothetical protein